MLKPQITLIVILIACVAFVSCERTQKMLEPVADDMMAGDDMMTGDDMSTDMMMDMMKMLDPSVYMTWAHVALPAPTMTVAEAKAAGDAAATGAAHNPAHVQTGIMTSRTVYFNEVGAMANKAGADPYPDGTVIVKAIMDDTETSVDKLAVMVKSPDPMYTDNGHGGWMYAKYILQADGTWELKAGSDVDGHGGVGCHGCHAAAGATNDKVFVSLSMDETPDMPDMPDADAGETPDMPDMPDADAGDTNGAATNGGDATTDAGNGNENGNGAGNGNGNGNGNGGTQ